MWNKPFAIILNEHAGNGRALEFAPDLKKTARELGGHCFVTHYPGHASSLAKQLSKRFELIFAAGGDDTIREVLQGLYGRDNLLGIIPLGTFNNIAYGLNLPSSPLKAFSDALDGEIQYVDIGKIENGLYFIESVGIGLDSLAWRKAPATEPLGFSRWTQGLRLGLETLQELEGIPVKIIGDDFIYEGTILQITIANSPTFASGFKANPHARLDDGFLDICVVPVMSKAKFLALVPLIYYGMHEGFGGIQFFKTQKVIIESPKATFARVDGMLAGKLPLRAHAIKDALPMLLPKPNQPLPFAESLRQLYLEIEELF